MGRFEMRAMKQSWLGFAATLLANAALPTAASAQSLPPGTSAPAGTARVRPGAEPINPAIEQPGVANALNPQPLPPGPPEVEQHLINPAIQPPGVAEALNPQPLPPEPPDAKPDPVNPAIQPSGVANALNPQPLPPEPPDRKKLKRRTLNKPVSQ